MELQFGLQRQAGFSCSKLKSGSMPSLFTSIYQPSGSREINLLDLIGPEAILFGSPGNYQY